MNETQKIVRREIGLFAQSLAERIPADHPAVSLRSLNILLRELAIAYADSVAHEEAVPPLEVKQGAVPDEELATDFIRAKIEECKAAAKKGRKNVIISVADYEFLLYLTLKLVATVKGRPQ